MTDDTEALQLAINENNPLSPALRSDSMALSGASRRKQSPSSGPTQWLFQGPPAESKVLAAEFVLGGSSTTNDYGKLPVISTSGSDMLFTFYRAQNSIDPKTSTTIEVSTNLETWNAAPSPYAVPDFATTANPGVSVEKNNPIAGSDKITLRLPQPPEAKTFARLKVMITP